MAISEKLQNLVDYPVNVVRSLTLIQVMAISIVGITILGFAFTFNFNKVVNNHSTNNHYNVSPSGGATMQSVEAKMRKRTEFSQDSAHVAGAIGTNIKMNPEALDRVGSHPRIVGFIGTDVTKDSE